MVERTILLLICLVLVGHSVNAQEVRPAPARGPRVPVLLAAIDSLPMTMPRFRIIRFAGDGAAQDVIALPSNADPEMLSQAVETLQLVWSSADEHSSANAIFRMVPDSSPTSPPRQPMPWAARVLEDLRTTHERHVPGLGMVRTVQIWIPRMTRTKRQR